MRYTKAIAMSITTLISTITRTPEAAPLYKVTALDGLAYASAINNLGKVAGRSSKGAAVWNAGTVIELGQGRATAINNSGQIAGVSYNSSDGQYHATLWSGDTVIDLGVLGREGDVHGINDSGQVVGWSYLSNYQRHALYWETGTLYDLNDLLHELSSGWTINDALAINDRGQIAANGCHTIFGCHGLRLDLVTGPTSAVPEPASFALFSVGLGALGLAHRRKRH